MEYRRLNGEAEQQTVPVASVPARTLAQMSDPNMAGSIEFDE